MHAILCRPVLQPNKQQALPAAVESPRPLQQHLTGASTIEPEAGQSPEAAAHTKAQSSQSPDAPADCTAQTSHSPDMAAHLKGRHAVGPESTWAVRQSAELDDLQAAFRKMQQPNAEEPAILEQESQDVQAQGQPSQQPSLQSSQQPNQQPPVVSR